ncbi:NUDIX domain-containing protein [Alkalicoccobacillus porphyridii]|uniref:NUDIX domain-containing protein n=1 Tax=Alkalicoccobacillus porphyridii TaxID=2597270 RepID=A0A554A428_9BACI|nr:NUDIX domain-containing protein [Alkalicoccobacillus porphyridii]TSB48442.1 NUDIX domain-containing protein [Alkalicoccobacillus porphyridii]
MSSSFRVRAGAFIIQDDAILLIKYQDESGFHYNLPGGGIHFEESLDEALKRELKEEASVDVIVGGLAFVYEYLPHLNESRYGDCPSLQFIFKCRIMDDQKPELPANPDPYQIGVVWMPLCQLSQIKLYPNLSTHLIIHAKTPKYIPYIKEQDIQ